MERALKHLDKLIVEFPAGLAAHLRKLRDVLLNKIPDPDYKCSAHGEPACVHCARSRPGGIDENGQCRECIVYGEHGVHWDTCANRIRGPLSPEDAACKCGDPGKPNMRHVPPDTNHPCFVAPAEDVEVESSPVDSERVMAVLREHHITGVPHHELAIAILAALPQLGRIDRLTAENEELRKELDHAERFGRGDVRVTTSAYDASCEALEKRRVLLVKALGLPDGTAFYDAVDTAERLATRIKDLEGKVLDEAARADTLFLTLGTYVAELGKERRLTPIGTHVEVRRADGKSFFGTVMPPPRDRQEMPGQVYVQPDERGKQLLAWPVEALKELVP